MPSIISLPCGSLSLERTAIMGILNTTPDSFFDGGSYVDWDSAVARAEAMVFEGADIIDVGGEKAGPGVPVSVDEELHRVIPVIEAIKRRLPVPVSVDTRRHEVAREAANAGADIINSITGFGDANLRRVARDAGTAIVIMHIKGRPRIANPRPHYDDLLVEILQFINGRVQSCLADGIRSDRIIVDPGPGFGKTTEHDLAIMRDLRQITALPYPVLMAASRKKFIGDILAAPVQDRLAGSLAVAAWGVLQGAKIVRVHDVASSARICRMAEAVLDPAWEPRP